MTHVHSVHIPVMGTGFTIDSPLKVARYGISSTISLVDDNLIEDVRLYYARLYHKDATPISRQEEDARAKRITAYLNLVQELVEEQIAQIKHSEFSKDSEITKYFELIDPHSPLGEKYQAMLASPSERAKRVRQAQLRKEVVSGSIDVNIMTKQERDVFKRGVKQDSFYSDTMSALRGFAQSKLNASVVFSAGLNPRLFGYASEFDDFHLDAKGEFKKRIILKVSDFRSALTQGKVFAKKGLWVSEYRIESGLNCGGHAFATTGHLLGPVLEEFKQKKAELRQEMHAFYSEALRKEGRAIPPKMCDVAITAQGGLGSHPEHSFMLRYFQLTSAGWGSPFLLVPEATTVDEETLGLLKEAHEKDIYLSGSSPLGVPFYVLKQSASERERLRRIVSGVAGSPCLNGYLAFDKELSEYPLCLASKSYQSKKIEQLKAQNLPADVYEKELTKITEKACICKDLGEGVYLHYGLSNNSPKKLTPAICPGPNLAYFSKIYSLKEMLGLIYGRCRSKGVDRNRPHVFIKELRLYLEYLEKKVQAALQTEVSSKDRKYFSEFKNNLAAGIAYYRQIVAQFLEETETNRRRFKKDLNAAQKMLDQIVQNNLALFFA